MRSLTHIYTPVSVVQQKYWRYVQLHCYLVDMEGEPVLTEHLECRWVPLSDLRDVPVPPADIPVIDAILASEARGWGTSSGAQ